MLQPGERMLDSDSKVVVIEATAQRQGCSNTAQIEIPLLHRQRASSTSNPVELLIR